MKGFVCFLVGHKGKSTNFAADLWCPSADSIGNRVRIPDSSRCCDGQSPATVPLKTKSFGKAANARPQSEDLPQVAKQGFRELELGFYSL